MCLCLPLSSRSNHVLFKCNDGQWEQEVDCTTTSTTVRMANALSFGPVAPLFLTTVGMQIGGLAHVCQCSASCHASFAQCSFSSNVCNSMRCDRVMYESVIEVLALIHATGVRCMES